MTHDEMIEVIQAHKYGKKIEVFSYDGVWLPLKPFNTFNFSNHEYRIKPIEKKKVKMWLWAYYSVYPTHITSSVHFYKNENDFKFAHYPIANIVGPILGTEIEVEE